MTRLDALAVEHRDAVKRVRSTISDLQALCVIAKAAIACDGTPSTRAMVAKAVAVEEATQIWQATRHALRMATERETA